ncbi:hypothetical protein Vretimale_13596 [Volvox reticuliferus]|uniref:RAP domain-containing protein n=1 Tax=Volvox reticuliferus TaxID=1737510 RepID=A0A8J4LTV7_9CHLO|nr:hypothetical protein Vretifemale_412 [Volvox reticuliferus]GIM09781.1 hypothetical protein Vretimale_13596 [Volvox reticuliferus]
MQTVYSSYISNESHGLFAQTVNWLRNRNRLHCPQFSWVKAAAQETQATKSINYVQAGACAFSSAQPLCRGQAYASPKAHLVGPLSANAADTAAPAASLDAGAAAVLGGSDSSGLNYSLHLVGVPTADGKLPPLNVRTRCHRRQDPRSPLATALPGPQNSQGVCSEHSPQHSFSATGRSGSRVAPRLCCRPVADNPEIAQLSNDTGMDIGMTITVAEIAAANWAGATSAGSKAGAAHARTRQSYLEPTGHLRAEMPYRTSCSTMVAPSPSQALCGRKHSHTPPPSLPPATTPAALQEAAIARGAAATASLSWDSPSKASTTPIGTKGLSASGLSAAIHAATSLDELVTLYDAQPEAFRSGHVSAALVRLPHAAGLRRTRTPRLRELRHEALLQQLLVRFEIHRAAGEYGTRDLSSCAWVLGTLGRRDCGALVSELAEHMLALRQQYLRQREAAAEWIKEPRNKGSAAMATKFGKGWKGDWQPSGEVSPLLVGTTRGSDATASPTKMLAVTATVVAVPPGRASDCTPLDLSNMALGMAKAGVTSPHLWKDLAAAAAAKKLQGFGTQETANFAWSLAHGHREFCRGDVGAAPRPYRAQEAADASGSAGASANATDARVTDCINDQWQGFVPWPGGCSGAMVTPSATRVLHPSWLPWARDFVEEVLAPRVRCMLRFYTTQQAANAAWALATLGHADSRTLGAVAAIASALAEGSMRAVAGPAAAATAVDGQMYAAAGPVAATRVVTAAADWPAQKGQRLTPQSVCMFVWAMATMVSTMRTSGDGTAAISSTSRISTHLSSNSSSSSINNRAGSSRSSVEHITDSIITTHSRDTRLDKGPKQSISESRYSLPPAPAPVPPLPDPPPEPAPLYQPLQTRPSTAIHPRALLALTRVASAHITRFSAQGLANLMWGLGVLGFQSPRELRQLAAREALLRLTELKPLGMATLLEDWARARRHHPELFAAAASLMTAKLYECGCSPGGDVQPRTLARLLRAYGAVGHANRRLFQMAAAALVPLQATATAPIRGTLQGTAVSAPLDELSPGELYQLVCAYGRVGVHAPWLMDEVLARLGPVLTVTRLRDGAGGGSSAFGPPPCAAGRLLCGLAVLGHRPAAIVMHGAHADGGDNMDAATASAAMAAFRVLRRSVLTGICVMTSRHALAAVWALVRLRAAGAPEVLQMAQLLVRRAAPGADNLAVGLAAVARTTAVSGNPVMLTRFVWVLGRGAAAAAADAERLRGIDSDAAAAEADAATAVFEKLSGGLLAIASALLGGKENEERDGTGAVTLHGDVIVALSEAIAAILAQKTRSGATAGEGAAPPSMLRLYNQLSRYFLTLVDLALRCCGTAAGPQLLPGQLTPRALADLVHAVYDSGVAATHPAVRVAAARQVLFRLQAVCFHNAGMATGLGMAAHRGRSYTRQPQWPHVQSHRHQQLPAKLSVNDLAQLLAAAARMELFDHPRAQPMLRDAARELMDHSALSGKGTATPDDGAATSGGAAVGAKDLHRASLSPVGLAALQELIRHCWHPDYENDGSGGGCSRRQLMAQDAYLANTNSPDCRGGTAGSAAAMVAATSSGRTLRRALYRWAIRQAQPLLPWLGPETRALVIKASWTDEA